MVGDTGFDPVTSTVCKRHKFWSQFTQICREIINFATFHGNELGTKSMI